MEYNNCLNGSQMNEEINRIYNMSKWCNCKDENNCIIWQVNEGTKQERKERIEWETGYDLCEEWEGY